MAEMRQLFEEDGGLRFVNADKVTSVVPFPKEQSGPLSRIYIGSNENVIVRGAPSHVARHLQNGSVQEPGPNW